MPHVMLDASGVMPVVGELEAAPVPEHMRVDGERQSGRRAQAGEHFQESGGGQGSAALGLEHIRGKGGFAAQSAQRPQLVATQRVGAGSAVLAAVDVQQGVGEVYLLPFQGAQLGHPQGVPVGRQNSGRVAVAVAVGFGGLHEQVHLGGGEVFAAAAVAVGDAFRRDCPKNGGRRVGHGGWF